MSVGRDNLTRAMEAERSEEQREADLARFDSRLGYLLVGLGTLYVVGVSAMFLLGRAGSELQESVSSATACVMLLIVIVEIARRRFVCAIGVAVISAVIWGMASDPSSFGNVIEYWILLLNG